MANQELITGEEDKQWVDDLKPLIKVLNKRNQTPLNKEISEEPIVDKYTDKLLVIGQKVRIQLDYPINNINDKRLNGTFIISDIRFSPKTFEITEVLLKPGFPPLYLTSNNDGDARTKNQLQVII